MLQFVKRCLLQGARIKAVGRTVPLVLSLFSFFAPHRIRKEDGGFFSMHHPTDIDNHVLILPVKYCADLDRFLRNELMCQNLYSLLKKNGWPGHDRTVLCNWGSRQEVKQVHFHLLSLSSLEIDIKSIHTCWEETENKGCCINDERRIIAVPVSFLERPRELMKKVKNAEDRFKQCGSVIFYEAQ